MKKVTLLAAGVLAAVAAAPSANAYTPNAYFGGYFRSGVMSKRFNKSDDLVHQVGRLGAENDTYGEIFLGTDVANVDDTVWSVNSRIAVSSQYNRDWQSTNNVLVSVDREGNHSVSTNHHENTRFAFREFNLTVKGLLDFDKDATVWAGKRFYHREDIHVTDLYYWDVSGMGAGVENLQAGPGKLSLAWLRRDDGQTYVDNVDSSVKKNGFRSAHIFDVQYDFPAWDGANIEVRDTFLVPQRDNDSTTKKDFHVANKFGKSNIFGVELGQGYSLGWHKTVLKWTHGSTARWVKFGTEAWFDDSGASDKANRYSIYNFGQMNFTSNFGMFYTLNFTASKNYDDTDRHDFNLKSDRAFQVVVRPYVQLTKMTKVLVELGAYTQTEKDQDGNSTTRNAQKYTVAYAITPDASNFWSRPELRIFATYIHGKKDGMQSVDVSSWGDSAQNRNFLVGVQAEAWW